MKKKLLISLTCFSTSISLKHTEKRLKWSSCFKLEFFLILILLFSYTSSKAQLKTHPFSANGSLELPAGIDEVTVEAWGAGGAGGAATASLLDGRGGGGGGGGAYAKGKITTVTPQTLSVIVGGVTTGGSGNGASGGASYIATYTSVFNAPGGLGGLANTGGTPSGGAGGAPPVGNIATDPGLVGKNGSAALLGLGAVFGAGAGGNAGNTTGGGGQGGPAISSLALGNSPGNPGNNYGGGGSGGLSSLLTTQNGGNGAQGHLTVTYTCKTYSLSTIQASSACTSTGTSSVQITGTATSLPKGTYTVTYNTSLPVTTNSTTFTVTTAGTGSFTASGFNTVGSSTITITNLTSVDCSSTISANNAVTIAVTARPTITLGSIAATCSSAAVQNLNLPYTATTNVPTNYSITWNASPTNSFAAINNAALPVSPFTITVPAGTAQGSYTGNLTVSNAGCVSISYPFTVVINALPVAPTASATKQPTCADNTGTITVTSPAVGSGFSYTIDGTNFNTTGSFTGLASATYNVRVRNNSTLCLSASTAVILNPVAVKSWNGSVSGNWSTPANWTPSGVPLASDCVVISPVGTSPVISGTDGTFFANRITIQNNGYLLVQSTNTLTVTNEVTVLGTGSFIFENNSSLVQVSNAVNTGNIVYRRTSKPVRRYDLTYWSSPITRAPTPFTLHDFSPNTLLDKYYKFDPNGGWTVILNGTEEMVAGNGYSIRAPQNYDLNATVVYGGEFTGVPNNGTILGPNAVAEKGNLLGNPYPSAIDADQFINTNAANYYGTLYFWTHNSLPSQSVPGDDRYYYNNDDFAIYNLSGITTIGSMTGTGATTPGNQVAPARYIGAGQGFMMLSKTGQKAVFTNGMRVSSFNSQFYKSAATTDLERHRVWLNLTNTQGAFKQLLIGYIEGATNLWDDNYDAITLDANPFLDFYSINGNNKLIIQGRALPFDEKDTIPLGYRSAIVGDFTIAIDRTDGNLSNQAIYLEDKVTNKIHNLQNGGYTFSTTTGVFTERFVLRYAQGTLETNNFASLDKNVFVSVKDKNIKLQAVSDTENLKEATIYDIGGKLLYHKKEINDKELLITNLQPAHQVLLVKITLDNGFTVTKKIVF